MEAKSRILVIRSSGWGRMGRCWSKGTRLKLCSTNKFRDLLYSIMTLANNIVFSTGNLLRFQVLSLQKKEKSSICEER